MKPIHSQPSTINCPELALQERFNAAAWLVFHTLALWTALSFWLRFKRVCAWHQPKMIRLGGNPFARRSTHGMCPECFARLSMEIEDRKCLEERGTSTLRQNAAPLLSKPPFNVSIPPTPILKPKTLLN